MLGKRLGALRRWIEAKSLPVRVGILLVALVLFRAVQLAAGVVQGGEPVVVLTLGVVVLAAGLILLYTIAVTLWSFVGDVRGRASGQAE